MTKLEFTTRLNKRVNEKLKEEELIEIHNDVLFELATSDDFDFYIEDNVSVNTVSGQKIYTYPANHRSGKTIFIRSTDTEGDDLDFEDFGTTLKLDIAPSNVFPLNIRQYRLPTLLVKTDSDSTTSDFPAEFHDILLMGSSAMALKEIREFDRAREYERRFEKRKQRMIETINASFTITETAKDFSVSGTQKSFNAGEWSAL